MPVFCWPETPYSPLLAQIFQATKVQEGRGRKRGREGEGAREEGGSGDLEVGGSGEKERLAKRRREESEEAVEVAVEVAALGDVTDWELTVLGREGEEGRGVGREVRDAKKSRGRQYSPTVFYPGTTVCLAEELEPLYR